MKMLTSREQPFTRTLLARILPIFIGFSITHLSALAAEKNIDTKTSMTNNQAVIEVYFPYAKNNSANPVIAEIEAAKKAIWIVGGEMYSLPLAPALLQAHKRGIAINVLVEKDTEYSYFMGHPQSFYQMLPFVTNYVGDDQEVRGHVMLIDGKEVITGYFDPLMDTGSPSLTSCFIIRNSPATAQPFLDEINRRLPHSHLSYLNQILTKRSPAAQEAKINEYFLASRTIIERIKAQSARAPQRLPEPIPPPFTLPALPLPTTIDLASLPQKQVTVSWTVDEFGSIIDAKVVSSSGNAIVDKQALDIVKAQSADVAWTDHGPIQASKTYTFNYQK